LLTEAFSLNLQTITNFFRWERWKRIYRSAGTSFLFYSCSRDLRRLARIYPASGSLTGRTLFLIQIKHPVGMPCHSRGRESLVY